LGEDFDFVYFVGARDLLAISGSTAARTCSRSSSISQPIDADADLAAERPDKVRRNYYALSVITFSKGAHDEWNIISLLNERRQQ
jgi:hypothetical protein